MTAQPHQVDVLHELACDSHDLAWAWQQTLPSSYLHCLPALLDGQMHQFRPCWQHLDLSSTVAPSQPVVGATVALQCVSVNVLALDCPDADALVTRRTAGRTVRLDEQMHARGVHVLGIQEARTPAGRFESDHYYILASGADRSHTAALGCELWLHKSLAWLVPAEGSSLTWAQACITVTHADPRRLLVQIKVRHFTWAFAVLHAPYKHASFSVDDLVQWWDQTEALIRRHCGSDWSVVFVDANADLPASDAEPAVDGAHPFQSFVSQLGLTAPLCCPSVHIGDSWTWTHPRGQRSRRDFILISESLLPWMTSSQVLYDHDNTFAHDDHVPVWLSLSGTCVLPSPAARLRWDQARLCDPLQVAGFREALHTLPIPTWQVRVDDHSELWHAQLLQLGQQFFAPTPCKRNRLGLSDSTRQAIGFKRNLLDAARKLGLVTDVDFKPTLRSVEKFVRKLVAQDLASLFDSFAVDVDCAAMSGRSGDLFQRLRKLGSRRIKSPGPRPLPALRKPDGTLATSFADQQRLWMDQFATTEAGILVTWQALQEVHCGHVNIPYSDLSVSVFPTEWQLLSCLSRLQRNKAPGPDQIPSALLKAGGTPLARQLATFLLKVVSTTTEPLPWKGGRAAPLWKGKSSPQDPASYRSIFISNFTTKLFHQCLRQHLVDSWLAGASSLQCGGRPSFGTDLAHHLVQAHAHWCSFHRRPHAVVFLDFKAAFYSVLRQGLTQFPIDPQRLFHDASLRGLDCPRLACLVHALRLDAQELGLEPHVDRMLADVLTNTFFLVDGVEQPCATARGTRPGDPVGDVLFNIVMARLLADFKRVMLEETGLPWLTDPGPHADFSLWAEPPAAGLGDISFVDDCAILVHTDHNDQLEHLLCHILRVFTGLAARRGLVVNFEAGKSEIVWSVVGPGARAAKQRLASKAHVLAWDPAAPHQVVRVVHAYRHLGTWIQATNVHRREILARGSATKQAWGPLARTFYGHRSVSTATKARVFHALSLSRFTFNAHIWCGITEKELHAWASHLRAPLLQIMRRPLHGIPAFELSTTVLAGFLGILPPEALLHVARLRYIGRFLKVCPPMLWNFISSLCEHGVGWLHDCRASFRWLCQFYRDSILPAAEAPLSHWLTWIRLDSAWLGRIRTAAAQCLRFHQRVASHEVWMLRFKRSLSQALVQLPSDVPAPPSPEWQCEVCAATFGSRRALATHAYKVHGYRAEVRYYGDSGLCNACGLLFHDRARLHRHLLGSSVCFDTYRATAPPLTEAEVDDLDEAARCAARALKQQGWLPTKALVAVQQTFGPWLPGPNDPGARAMYDRRALRTVNPGIRFRCLEGRRIDAPRPSAGLWWTSVDVPPLVFQSTGGAQVGGGAFSMGGLARDAARLHIRALTFVHFFSGFRRQDDLHDILEHVVCPDGHQIFVISVDICLQKSDANLASPTALAWWKRRIHDGLVVGAGGGPPCETWSAARLVDGGPPPLRSAQYLWGLPTLSVSHSQQVAIGTRLLEFLWALLVDLAMAGGCGFCEHPQYPLWASTKLPASIWIAEPSRLLRGLSCFQAVSFDQCTFGAEAVKPTTLLLLRLPAFRTQALCSGRMGRCAHGYGAHEGLVGLQEDGAFKTSRCKIYPAAMNRALAAAIRHFVCSTFTDCVRDMVLPEDFTPFIHAVFASDGDVQRDYYPEAAAD
eukprot:Skav234501  [mRNA]  locus=scaffold1613:29949:34970:- [translate_table: standard]